MAADLGVNELILWGQLDRADSKDKCEYEKAHVERVGPYIKRLLAFFEDCARDLCSNNGRCAKNCVEVDPTKMNTDLDQDHVYNLEEVKELYHCRCYEGWTGQDCSEMGMTASNFTPK